MAFPKMALFCGLGAGMAMLVLGRPVFLSLAAGVLLFMATGGLQYIKTFFVYLRRDLW